MRLFFTKLGILIVMLYLSFKLIVFIINIATKYNLDAGFITAISTILTYILSHLIIKFFRSQF